MAMVEMRSQGRRSPMNLVTLGGSEKRDGEGSEAYRPFYGG